jgi:hypothetical protein
MAYLKQIIAGNDMYILVAAAALFIVGILSSYKSLWVGITVCLSGIFLILLAILANLRVSLPF